MSAADEAEAETSAKAEKKGPTQAQIVASHVLAEYDFERTPDGQTYAVPKYGPKLPVPFGESGGPLRHRVRAAIRRQSGMVVGDSALTAGISIGIAVALQSPLPKQLHLRVAEVDPGKIVLDLGWPDDTTCVVITADGWRIAAEPPTGVYFRRPPSLQPLPVPKPDSNLDHLRGLLGFAEDDPRWLLIRGWLVACMRPNIPRPALLPLGASGTGKTTRAHCIVNVLDPRPEFGGSFGRNLDDDQVKAYGRYLLGYDNLTTISEAVSDHICRMVTGEAAEKRQNYSDTGVVVVHYRRTGVMTAISMPALRSDALERVIVIPLDRMPATSRRAESELQEEFARTHPATLGAVLDGVVTMLHNLPSVEGPGPRMLDYYKSLMAYDPACAQAYIASAEETLVAAAEDDPFVSAILAWLDAREVTGELRLPPTEAYEAISKHAREHSGTSSSWWPDDSHGMSRALARAAGPLAAVGVEFASGKSNGRRQWKFTVAR